MCDLHLSFYKKAIQYDVLQWAIGNINENHADCIIFAGDVTADGNLNSYDFFLEKISDIKIPFLYIPGNSDLRDETTREQIYNKSSVCFNVIDGIKIFAINDSDRNISETQLKELEKADSESIVFMHHPINCLKKKSQADFIQWRESHNLTKVFYGHEHCSRMDGNNICLQAMDPDKSIGESPCITYYDTQAGVFYKSHYLCSVPKNLTKFFGISCYRPKNDIIFAIQNGLRHLELRPNIVSENEDDVINMIFEWRKQGNTNLSVHLPDVTIMDGEIVAKGNYERLIELGIKLNAERFTQHVPDITVALVKKDRNVLNDIAKFIAERINAVPYNCVIGVENMHTTDRDEPNDNRRFGYLPEEVLKFMSILQKECKQKVGINFDIGHARNNAPYSQKYQISTWLAMLGEFIVGYHIHQVKECGGTFENHTAIDNVYGRLISFASFFRCWAENRINHAPVIFEMRTPNAYEITLDTFNKDKEKKRK